MPPVPSFTPEKLSMTVASNEFQSMAAELTYHNAYIQPIAYLRTHKLIARHLDLPV